MILVGCFSGVGVGVFFFKGDVFFLFRATWVHPSSSLLGRSPASGLGLSFVVTSVIVVVVVDDDDVVAVGGDDVGFGGLLRAGPRKNDPTVYSSNIEVSYPQRPPSLLYFHTLILGVWPDPPPLLRHMVRK